MILKKQVSFWMAIHVQLNKLMPWIKLCQNLVSHQKVLSILKVNPESLLERLSGRFICRTCGATYHKVFNPTKVEGTCDNCQGHDFYQREDDKPETVKRRLDVNIAQGEPIIEFYRSKGLVHDIQGNQDINDVFSDIEKVLSNLKIKAFFILAILTTSVTIQLV